MRGGDSGSREEGGGGREEERGGGGEEGGERGVRRGGVGSLQRPNDAKQP